MNTLDILDHETAVVWGNCLGSGIRVYRAECSCGWVSEWSDDQADSDDARNDHHEVVG